MLVAGIWFIRSNNLSTEIMSSADLPAKTTQHRYLIVLCFLMSLFCLRVVGQALVAFFNVSFLPPMEEWFSGILPYPELLVCQILIVLLYGKICSDFARNRGYFVTPNPRLGGFLLQFGGLYLWVMILRYIIRMSLYPAERWVGGSIPTFFHWVLALFLIVLGGFHWSTTRRFNQASRVARSKTIHSWGRWVIAGAVFVGTFVWVSWLTLPSIVAHQLGLRRSYYAVRAEQHVSMIAADGVALRADIFHPEHAGRTPTILVRIPFSKSFKNCFFEEMIGRIWAERGYTVVVQGTRGRYESDGSYYPLRGERDDGIQTLHWIARQPWFDGKIATWGGSAFGYTQFAIADQVNPGPTVLDIYEASTNFHGMFYPGGAFSLYSALSWTINSHGKEDLPDWPANYDIARGANGFPLVDADKRAIGKEVVFFRDWVNHREADSYWTNIDGIDRAAKIKAPVLLMGGWYDPFLPTQLDDFVRIRRLAPKAVAQRSKLIVGPWKHAGEVIFPDGSVSEKFRQASLSISLPWFDRILHTKNGSQPAADSSVRIFVMGSNKWRDEQEWPLARTRYTPFYLESHGSARGASSDGHLCLLPATHDEPDDTYVYDPRDPVPTAGGAMIGRAAGIANQDKIEFRSDVLNYTTPILKEDTEVTGPVTAILFVTTSSACTDFTAKLVDVHADGSAFNVCDGIIRRQYARPQAPGKAPGATEIRIDLWPTSIVFLKGHQLRLEISSSNFPRFDRNPNTGNPVSSETAPVIAHQSIRHGVDYPSRLILPIIPERN
jgi:uncharacterized protein